MEKQALLTLIAEIVEVDEVSESSELDGLGWDSLSNLSFIAEVDEQFDVSLDAAELAEATTVSDLIALVEKA